MVLQGFSNIFFLRRKKKIMNSLASDAETDILSDDEYESCTGQVPRSIQNLSAFDIVRFSTHSAETNSCGRILEIRDVRNENIKEIDINHFDKKLKGQSITYSARQISWICREDKMLPDTPIKRNGIHPKM